MKLPSRFEPCMVVWCRARFTTILNHYEWAGKKYFVSLKLEGQSGVWTRDLRTFQADSCTSAPVLTWVVHDKAFSLAWRWSSRADYIISYVSRNNLHHSLHHSASGTGRYFQFENLTSPHLLVMSYLAKTKRQILSFGLILYIVHNLCKWLGR